MQYSPESPVLLRLFSGFQVQPALLCSQILKDLIQSGGAHTVTFGEAGQLEKQELVGQPESCPSHHLTQALILNIHVTAAKCFSFLVSQLSFSANIHPSV